MKTVIAFLISVMCASPQMHSQTVLKGDSITAEFQQRTREYVTLAQKYDSIASELVHKAAVEESLQKQRQCIALAQKYASESVAYQMVATQLQRSEEGKNKVYGTVIDAVTRMPIRSAVVEILGTTLKDTTGFDGQYKIKEVPTGFYQIRASASGYESQIQNNVYVPPHAEDVTRFFELKSNPEIPPDYVPVEKQPIITHTVQPNYPASARRDSIEGIVWVKVIVREDGTTSDATIIQSHFTGPDSLKIDGQSLNKSKLPQRFYNDVNEFHEVAKKTIMQWKFKPAILNGKPTKVWVTIPFKFKLEPQESEKKSSPKK